MIEKTVKMPDDFLPLLPLSEQTVNSKQADQEKPKFAGILKEELNNEESKKEVPSVSREDNLKNHEKKDSGQTAKAAPGIEEKPGHVKAFFEKGPAGNQAFGLIGRFPIPSDKQNASSGVQVDGENLPNNQPKRLFSELVAENQAISRVARETALNLQAERTILQAGSNLEKVPERVISIKQALGTKESIPEMTASRPEKAVPNRVEYVPVATDQEKPETIQFSRGAEEQTLLKSVAEMKPMSAVMETARIENTRDPVAVNTLEPRPLLNAERYMVPETLVRRVESAVLMMLDRHDNRLTVKLHPPELGRVQIELQIRNGGAEVRIHTENPLVREVVLSNLEQLRNNIENSGYLLNRLDVEVGGFSRFAGSQGQRRAAVLRAQGHGGQIEETNEEPGANQTEGAVYYGGRVNLIV